MGLRAVAQPVVGQLPGTATNDSASAGNVGEYISSTLASGSAVTLTTATPLTVTSISLTPGDWDVWGTVSFVGNGSTTAYVGAISSTNNGLPTNPAGGAYWQLNLASGATLNQTSPVGMTRVSLSATTTYYLVAASNFTGSANTAYGFIGARRVR